MNKRKLNRVLRKELLLLQAAQYRQRLAEDLRAFVPSSVSSDAMGNGSAMLIGSQLLASILPQGRWRKWLIYGLAVSRIALAVSRAKPR